MHLVSQHFDPTLINSFAMETHLINPEEKEVKDNRSIRYSIPSVRHTTPETFFDIFSASKRWEATVNE